MAYLPQVCQILELLSRYLTENKADRMNVPQGYKALNCLLYSVIKCLRTHVFYVIYNSAFYSPRDNAGATIKVVNSIAQGSKRSKGGVSCEF